MQKKKIDFHVHSDFSSDSETPLENMVMTAVESGITDLAITDHVDYDYDLTADITSWEIDEAAYDEAIQQFKEQYRGTLNLYKGIEFGVQPHLAERMETFISRGNFDFVIASQHTVDGIDLYNGAYFNQYSALESIRHYYEMYDQCAKMTNAYSVLGHLDLYLRYKKDLKTVSVIQFMDIIDSIFDHIIYQGKGIEVNAGGHKYKLGDNNPTIDILRRYREKGGEVITLGSDAHTPNYLGLMHDENIALLDGLGFKYICSFEKMKPVFHSLNEFK
ncbi:histidinol-phosphatase HisJ family protein [Fusibacter paucivorans]|uniref:Histidinol-phosphatase n=1 Tax=Fusibacter paucivorans TaxID=76009 RepID=A0ABS5PLL4_9FIRM|nr:histidinol-phosphatase HisJ family protein [Fusibacter paucivorans]MBS7526055.1 histidinol-phosphatase HisJ family protein [Fusibacter paucivorans]